MKSKLTDTQERAGIDFGILALRIGLGLTMLTHGIPKLLNFSEKSAKFADPLGVGSELSLSLAIFSELFCSIFLLFGFLTRFSAAQLLITMAVAFFIVHGGDPFKERELSMMYLIGYVGLLLTGGGRYSIDRLLFPLKEDGMLEAASDQADSAPETD